MKNKPKLWRDIGAKRGALARKLQEGGSSANALTLRQNIRQSKRMAIEFCSFLPSMLMQNLLQRAGIVKRMQPIAG